MRATPIDDMITFALEELLSGDERRQRALVRRMCGRWPTEPALSVVFAMTSAASMIEDNFKQSGGDAAAGAGAFRLAALVAADVYAVESMGHSPARAQDLLHFWRRVDPFFLDL